MSYNKPTKKVLSELMSSNTMSEIAAIYQVNPSTVSRWRKSYRLPDGRLKSRKLTPDQVREIRRTFEQWREEFGVSRSTLFSVLTYQTYIEVLP